MSMELGNELFDWKLYGLLIRKMRTDIGYKKAEDFSEGIWRRTRVRISRDTLYKIEQGRQIPDASQFMALNLAVSSSLFNLETVSICTSRDWRSIADGMSIPKEWKKENSETAWKSSTGMESPDDLVPMKSVEDTEALISKQAYVLANDEPVLFDEEVDSEWHDALEACLKETYGVDAESWPRN